MYSLCVGTRSRWYRGCTRTFSEMSLSKEWIFARKFNGNEKLANEIDHVFKIIHKNFEANVALATPKQRLVALTSI